MKRVDVASILSKNLAFSDTAKALFEYVNSIKDEQLALDFSNVDIMTASFAKAYLKLRFESSKNIIELNTNQNVSRMFNAVSSLPARPHPIRFNSIKNVLIFARLVLHL